jgi:hypothetical protein
MGQSGCLWSVGQLPFGGGAGLDFELAGRTACPFGQAATLLSPSVGITICTGQILTELNR